MAIALVNQTWAALTATASQNITIPATTAGNCLLITVNESAASTAAVWTPSDAAADSFTAPTVVTVANGPPPVGWQSGTNSFTSFGYAFNIAAGTTTITITQSGTARSGNIGILEFSGVASASAVDTSTGAGAVTATTQTTAALGALAAGDVVVGSIGCPATSTATLLQGSSTPASGWTALTGSNTNVTHQAAYQVFASAQGAGTKVAWTMGATTPVGIVAIALKAAAGGVTNPLTLTATNGTTSATIVRQASKPLLQTVSTIETLNNRISKTLSASTVASTATLQALKVILRTLSASTVTGTATLARQIAKPLSVTTSSSATLGKRLTKTFSATVSGLATLSAVFIRGGVGDVAASLQIADLAAAMASLSDSPGAAVVAQDASAGKVATSDASGAQIAVQDLVGASASVSDPKP